MYAFKTKPKEGSSLLFFHTKMLMFKITSLQVVFFKSQIVYMKMLALEGLMLKLQYFGHLTQRADSLEKSLMLGKIEGRRRGDDRGWDGWVAPPTRWTWLSASSRSCWWTGKPGLMQSLGPQRVGRGWAAEQQQLSMESSQGRALNGEMEQGRETDGRKEKLEL